MYRPPLYPFLAGIFIFMGDSTGVFLVIFQHLLLIACVPGIYVIGRMFNYSQESSCIAAAFLALNSLLMQAAGYIMTEIVFLTLALTAIAIIKRLYNSPSILLSILTGITFATATYCRQMLFPVFFAGIVLLVVKMGKRGIILGFIAFSTYFIVTAPWCLRNFAISGHYTMSTSPGIQLFTKAVTFDCLDHTGNNFMKISAPLQNVLADLSLTGFTKPTVPENDWQVNRIPHVLMDSLRLSHGYSFADASSLLGKTAIEGFMKYPLPYAASVWASLSTLLFKHHDMFPNSMFVMPLDNDKTPFLFKKFQQGIVYVSGFLLLLFPIAIIFSKTKSFDLLIPFCIVCVMYTVTAAVQIGFTRYTIPWEPLKILGVAYLIETVLLSFFSLGLYLKNVRLFRNANYTYMRNGNKTV
jgi:4-amino-4-deoxy-L-arabinose transferase-like glycosyltransferase